MSDGRRDRPLARHLPRPGNLWIRWAPRLWPAPPSWWVSWTAATLGGSRGPAVVPDAALLAAEDVVYLPPVARALRADRDRLAAELGARGVPAILQLACGDPVPALGTVRPVVDLLPLAVGDAVEPAPLAAGFAGLTGVWPLLAGPAATEERWDAAAARLAAAGFDTVQAMVVDLQPVARRELASRGGELDEHTLAAHFAPLPDPAAAAALERSFARVARRHGIRPFIGRPVPIEPAALALGRRLGELLGVVADLWLRLGRPAPRGEEFWRAARWVDRTRYDLAALAREGNLGVLDWLDAESRRIVEEFVATGRCGLREELEQEYVAE